MGARPRVAHAYPGAICADLHQDAGAVAHARIGANRAAMLEIEQNGEAVVDNLVRLASVKIGDEADANAACRPVKCADVVQSRIKKPQGQTDL